MIRKGPIQQSRMTHEEAVARSCALTPAIQAQAATAETQRRLSEETVQAIIDAGLIRLLVPARLGGYELSIETALDAVIEIAMADASAGWCYSFFVSHPILLLYFSEQAQDEVWGNDPDALISTSLTPIGRFTPAEGGYRLNGNWAWSSGVDWSDWILLSALPASMDGPPRFFLLPRSDCEVIDTWFVAGLAASGSQNVEVKDIFVPAHRTALLSDLIHGLPSGSTLDTRKLNTLPLFTFFGAFIAAPLLGATIGAYEIWRERSRQRQSTMSHELVTTSTHQQIRLAETAVDISASRALLNEALAIIRSGAPIPPAQYNQIRLSYSAIARFCVGAMERIFINGGAGANYSSNPLQRFWRDIHTMSAHIGFSFDLHGEAFARSEFGLPPSPHDPFAL